MLNTTAHIALRRSSIHHEELGSMELGMRHDIHLDGR